MRRFGIVVILTLALLGAGGGPGWAQDGGLLTGTLQTIKARGSILIGYREGAVPFSFANQAGQPVGFSIDICRGIATDVAAVLNSSLLEPDAPSWQTGIRIIYVPVAADARLPKVISGEVDLECGSTTATKERAKTVAFSPVFFLAGTKLMVPTDSPVSALRDLAGKTVVASVGTTNSEAIQRLAARVAPPVKLVETPSTQAAYEMLDAGRADAFASDDVLLSGFIATKPDGRRFHIVGDYLSYEPYAIVIRRDDPDFAGLVMRSFERMATEGTLNGRYARWFTEKLPNGDNLNLPISPQLAEMFRVLGEPD